MATSATSAITSVHLNDPDSITMTAFPRCEAGPFVAVRLEPVAVLIVHDLVVLDALAVQIGAAREALAALLAGQDQLSEANAVATVHTQLAVRR